MGGAALQRGDVQRPVPRLLRHDHGWRRLASRTQLDLIRCVPLCFVWVKYIDLVSLDASKASRTQLDLDRAPYVLYGVKYIGLVSLAPLSTLRWPAGHKVYKIKMACKQHLDSIRPRL